MCFSRDEERARTCLEPCVLPLFRRIPRPLGSVATAVLIALAAGLWVASGEIGAERVPEGRKPPATLATENQRPAVRVRTQTDERHTETLTVQGHTQADRTVTLRAETEGRIADLPVNKGDRVAAGDLVAAIDPRDKPAKLKEAEALLEQRRLERQAAQSLSDKGYRARTQLAESKAQYEEAEARVRQAEVALATTRLHAPFAGTVAARHVENGDYVTPGTALAEVVDLDPIKLAARISERNVGRLTRGDTVTARPVTGETLEGRIVFLGAVADAETRTFALEAEAPNPDRRVRAGLTAELRLPLRATRAHKVTAAVLTLAADGRIGVKVVDDTDRVRFYPVEVVADTNEGVWVTGLPETIRLITVGQNFVEAGQQVRPVDEEVPTEDAGATGADTVTDAAVLEAAP